MSASVRGRSCFPTTLRLQQGQTGASSAQAQGVQYLFHFLLEGSEHLTAFGKGVLELFKLLCIEGQLERGRNGRHVYS